MRTSNQRLPVLTAAAVTLLASVAHAQVNPGNQFFSGPLAPAPLTPQGQPPPDGVAQYTYGYKTEDPAEATYSEQNEQRNGNSVSGFYSTLLPDGRVQVVNYVADEGGYRASVTYQTTDGFPLPNPQQPPGSPPPRAEPRQPTFLFAGPLPPLTADLGPGFGRRVDNSGGEGGGGGRPAGFGGPAKRETGPQGGQPGGQQGGPGPLRPPGQSGPHAGGPQIGGGQREGPLPLSGGRPQIRRLRPPGPAAEHHQGEPHVHPHVRPDQPPPPQVPLRRQLPLRPVGDAQAPWSQQANQQANTVSTGGPPPQPVNPRQLPISQPSPSPSPSISPPPPPPPSPTASAWLIVDNTIRHGRSGSPADGQPPAARPTQSAPGAGPAPDGSSWSYKTGPPPRPVEERREPPPPPPAAGFSARQGRFLHWPSYEPPAARSPRQSGLFSEGGPQQVVDETHPLAQFIYSPARGFSPPLGDWEPMRIRT